MGGIGLIVAIVVLVLLGAASACYFCQAPFRRWVERLWREQWDDMRKAREKK